MKIDDRDKISDLSEVDFIRLIDSTHKFSDLKVINLYNHKITDDTLKALARNSHKLSDLQNIDLGKNKITN